MILNGCWSVSMRKRSVHVVPAGATARSFGLMAVVDVRDEVCARSSSAVHEPWRLALDLNHRAAAVRLKVADAHMLQARLTCVDAQLRTLPRCNIARLLLLLPTKLLLQS